MRNTYRRYIEEQLRQIRDNAVDILILLDEAVALAVRDLANDVKGVELQPAREVAGLGLVDVQPLRLLEEQLGRVVDKRLVLHQGRHGKGRVDAAAKLHVEVVVRRAEQRGQAVALDHGLLDDVEVGLGNEVRSVLTR
jgi:hypothetical protein